ncbi:hypothetical protein [Williamsia sp.]|uniref:hypothetical protein n=1 Tax=Williamsia sp. TaxID=1872085 RepID=UPI001A184716|nr:hypothetical protein [Williamsia sp.]MBJ7289330.1 hypothetical protein [Williamsia sp.]
MSTGETADPVVSTAAVLAFGRRWSAYGGGPAEDIMVEFGWTSDRFFTELEQLLSSHPPGDLSAPVVASMIEVCRRRIWMGQ